MKRHYVGQHGLSIAMVLIIVSIIVVGSAAAAYVIMEYGARTAQEKQTTVNATSSGESMEYEKDTDDGQHIARVQERTDGIRVVYTSGSTTFVGYEPMDRVTDVEVVDINFDGHDDLQVSRVVGAYNGGTDFFVYDAKQETFSSYNPFTIDGSSTLGFTTFKPKERTLTTFFKGRGLGDIYVRHTFRFSDGVWRPVRTEEQDLLWRDMYPDLYEQYDGRLYKRTIRSYDTDETVASSTVTYYKSTEGGEYTKVDLSGMLQRIRSEYEVSVTNDGETLAVTTGDGANVHRLTIDEFNQWSTQHWDSLFDKRPAFGELGEVDFDNFQAFDRTARIAPDGERVAFSVSEYRSLTTASFVGVFDISSGEIDLIAETQWGDVREMRWSPDGVYVAYLLDSARARGDGLSVDNMNTMRHERSLEGEDVVSALGIGGQNEGSSFTPRFRQLNWVDADSLTFTSDPPRQNEETVRWRIDLPDASLQEI